MGATPSAVETLVRMNAELKAAIGDALDGLIDEQIRFAAPALDSRGIDQVAVHAYRPVLAVACVVAGEDWPERDPDPPDLPGLMRLLEAMYARVDALLTQLPSESLARTISLRWASEIGALEALVNVLAHGFVHVGAIRGIRAIGGFPPPAEET